MTKADIEFNALCQEIDNSDEAIWFNPALWTKKEWKMYDRFLYFTGFGWRKRHKAKKLLKKAIKKQKSGDIHI